jgi:hypothetical protein
MQAKLIKPVRGFEAQRQEKKRKEGEERERKQAQMAAEYEARVDAPQKEFALLTLWH